MSASPLWIFGYGSLVWRPGFAHAERHHGFIRGVARRFWQGSIDHRGLPGAPGRVVTLVAAGEHERCWGTVYRVEPGHEHEVLASLDFREQGGYERRRVEVFLEETNDPRGSGRGRGEFVMTQGMTNSIAEVLVYHATPDNPNWLGDAPLQQIAAQVRRSVGPSGPNLEYVLRLADALAAMGAQDEHVEALARLLRG